ncbi:MAG: BrnT family toxin [candidate division NC10 bacterium]|nr:BrnT family toxin [candidate division NC10 bacterium]MDE2485326.1 BrnT family toxin [candidate division NC10 bacterium]
MIDFEWDPTKAMGNLRKHGVAFREAATVFRDPLSITVYDPDHSEEEDRYITVGTSMAGRFLIVAHTDRGTRTRIINARELTRAEREAYESEIQRRKG